MLHKPLQRVRREGVEILIAGNGLALARLGIIVGRGYDRRSTRRHRFKRQVREAFRHKRDVLSGLDVLVRARSPVSDAVLNLELEEVLEGCARAPVGAEPERRALGARVVLALLAAYQLVLSPLLGPRCRFYPTCSSYAIQAVREHGVWRGGVLTMKRLFKCHPWHVGGHDPVPTLSPQGS